MQVKYCFVHAYIQEM